MEYFTEFAYLGMFMSAFLAATILPLSSEVVLSALLLDGLDPTGIIALATIGNVSGSLLNYGLGFWLNNQLIKKVLRLSDQQFSRAEERLQKYGLVSLFLAWVPVIGDPLTVIAGILRVNIIWFLILVTLGKFLRYAFLAYVILKVA